MKYIKWFAGSVGVIIAVAHIGVIGHLIKKEPVQINYPPAGDYTTYSITVNPDGSYTIDYKGHDPTVLDNKTYTDQSNGVFGIDSEGKPVARSEECIKAEGGGENAGRLVGASLGAAVAPSIAGIPYIGWLAAGWAVMLGQDMGSNVGGNIATQIKGC
jgi:hypothetical protein